MKRESFWTIGAKTSLNKIIRTSINNKINSSNYSDGIIANSLEEAKELIAKELSLDVENLGLISAVHYTVK